MAGQKSFGRLLAKDGARAINNLFLGTPDVRKERSCRQNGPKALDQVDDSADGRRKNYDLAALACLARVFTSVVDGAPLSRDFEDRRAIASNDAFREFVFLQR
jgi:hypothetical protein